MSSTTHSPPETPQRKIAVENGNVTPRTRLPDEATKVNSKGSMLPPDIVKPDEAANIPSEVVDSQAGVEEGHEAEQLPATSDAELLSFDWEDFRARYMMSLEKANDVEDALSVQFEQYSEAFTVWAQAAAERDNERAQKRLKTRELFVQLSERDLEDKKAHYVNVVDAFKGALMLLQDPSPRHKTRPRHG